MRLLWARAARDDIVAIRRFIAERNPQAAGAIAARILRSVELLLERPNLRLRTHRADVRRLIVGQSA